MKALKINGRVVGLAIVLMVAAIASTINPDLAHSLVAVATPGSI